MSNDSMMSTDKLQLRVTLEQFNKAETGEWIDGKAINIRPVQHAFAKLGPSRAYEPLPWEDDDIKKKIFFQTLICSSIQDQDGTFKKGDKCAKFEVVELLC